MIKSYRSLGVKDNLHILYIQDDEYGAIEIIARTIWHAIEMIYIEPDLVAANLIRATMMDENPDIALVYCKEFIDVSKYGDALKKYLILL